MAKGKVNFEWQKKLADEPVEYICGICGKTKSDRVYYQLGICKKCERVIRAFVPSAAEKTVSQITEEDLKKIKYLFKRGVNPNRITPVCRICGEKRKSFKEMSDPVNLVCINCYKAYVKTMLPQGRWALNKITLLDTEFKHMHDAYIHDKYYEEDKKKLDWFLAEYGGTLPSQEHMDSLVGTHQALRIRLMYKNMRREAHAKAVEQHKLEKAERQKNKTPQELEDQKIQYQLLDQYGWIMPSTAKLTEILGDEEQAKRIDLRDRKRRCYMYRKMTPEERKAFRTKRKEIRKERGF